MKKLILALFAFALLLPEAAQAQTYPVDRGSWIVGGAAGLTSSSADDDDGRSTSIFLNPNAQYFVRSGLAVGGHVTLSYSSQDNFSSTSVGVGPAVSFYFGSGARSVYPFVSAGTSVSSSTISIDRTFPGDIDLDRTTTSYSFDVAGGAVFMVAKNVGVTGAVFYREQHFNLDADSDAVDDDDFDINSFGFRFGLRLFAF